MKKISDSDYLGVMVYMDVPSQGQNKLITAHNELLVDKFVYQIIELIKEMAPVAFMSFYSEIAKLYPDKKKNEIMEIVNQLIDYEVLETLDDVW